MKPLPRLGALVSIGVIAAFAICTSQAFAAGETTLCKTNETTCVPGNQYGATEFKWTAANTELVTASGNISCTKAKFTNKTAGAAGTPLLGGIGAMAFETCTWKGQTCSVTAVNLTWKTEITRTTNPDGIMKIVAEKGEPRLAFSCAAGLFKCVYGAETTVEIHGGNPAETVFKEQALGLKIKEGTVECPMTIKWNANYTAEAPTAVYVTKN